jgi:four helix bundle protein
VKYTRFEDLPVWKSAIELAVQVYLLTAQEEFRAQRGLRDQLERAVVSISNNIAEGFERGTTQELLTFLYIARGSSGEVRSMLGLLNLLPPFGRLKEQVHHLNLQALSISRQLGGWAASLQNSKIKGLRHMNDKTRRSSRMQRDREEFLEELRRMQEERIVGLEKGRLEKEQSTDLPDR